MTNRLALLLLLAACVAFGAIIFIEVQAGGSQEAAVAEVAAAPDSAPAAKRQQNPRIDELVSAILARPLFSNTRRPPQNAAGQASTDSDLADTRLTGIVTAPGKRIAIFAITGDKPLKAAEGDAVSGWRVESITRREVALSGPTGTTTLRPKIDPSLAPPPGQPAVKPGGRQPVPPTATARPPNLPVATGVQPNSAGAASNSGVLTRPVRLRQQR
jgi:hypothetical protein